MASSSAVSGGSIGVTVRSCVLDSCGHMGKHAEMGGTTPRLYIVVTPCGGKLNSASSCAEGSVRLGSGSGLGSGKAVLTSRPARLTSGSECGAGHIAGAQGAASVAAASAAMASSSSPAGERGGCELLHGNWRVKGEGGGSLLKINSSHHHHLHQKKESSDRNKGVWRMEMASDPLNNCRDSFGNECAVEKRARRELEMSEPYRQVVNEIKALKNTLAEAVVQQRFEEAVPLRDYIDSMELRKRVLEISAKPRTAYRVGDIVVHRRYGYRGVIYGHDPECSAPEDWQEAMRIDMLAEGRNQPFYHVLVDTRDRPGVMSTYVAQENIVLQRNTSPVQHPWINKFFVGFHDAQYMPGSKLRQVYPNDW